MDLQRRDRGSVRTAKDIEMKYDLSRIEKTSKKLQTESERVDELIEDTKELEIKYELAQKVIEDNKKEINHLKDNKADRTELEELDNKKANREEIPSKLSDLKNDKGFITNQVKNLANYYDKKKIDEMLKGFTAQISSIKRKRLYYYTTKEIESSFKLLSEYSPGCLIDVFVNGFKLEEDRYNITLKNGEYYLNLKTGLDVIGTLVEIDMIEMIKEG